MMKTMNLVLAAALLAPAAGGCIDDGEDITEVESEIISETQASGGFGGRPFRTSNADPANKIVGIRVRSANEIDGLQITYANGVTESWGGRGGDWNAVFEIFPGEELVGIIGKTGRRVDSIRFVTSTGRMSQKYGGDGGTRDYSIRIPVGHENHALGFHGRAQDRIDRIGLVYWTP
jgi:hypothetical protein